MTNTFFKKIQNDNDAQQILKRIDELMELGVENNDDLYAELYILASIVQEYEHEKYKIKEPTLKDQVEFLMDQNNIKNTDPISSLLELLDRIDNIPRCSSEVFPLKGESTSKFEPVLEKSHKDEVTLTPISKLDQRVKTTREQIKLLTEITEEMKKGSENINGEIRAAMIANIIDLRCDLENELKQLENEGKLKNDN